MHCAFIYSLLAHPLSPFLTSPPTHQRDHHLSQNVEGACAACGVGWHGGYASSTSRRCCLRAPPGRGGAAAPLLYPRPPAASACVLASCAAAVVMHLLERRRRRRRRRRLPLRSCSGACARAASSVSSPPLAACSPPPLPACPSPAGSRRARRGQDHHAAMRWGGDWRSIVACT